METSEDIKAISTCATALDALFDHDSSLVPEVLEFLMRRYAARLSRNLVSLDAQAKVKTAQIEAAKEVSQADLLDCLICQPGGPHKINYDLLKEKLAAQDNAGLVM